MSKLSSLYKSLTGEKLSDTILGGGKSKKKALNLDGGLSPTMLLLIAGVGVGVYFIAKKK